MTLDDLIEELENARKEKGGNAEVIISCQKKPGNHGLSELVTLNFHDVIFCDSHPHVGIWTSEKIS